MPSPGNNGNDDGDHYVKLYDVPGLAKLLGDGRWGAIESNNAYLPDNKLYVLKKSRVLKKVGI